MVLKYTSSSSTSVSYSSDSGGSFHGNPKNGSGLISLGLTIKARPAQGDDVNVGMSAHARTTSGGNGDVDYSMNTKVKSGKVDKLAVTVDVGDWAREPNDRDDLDFLILVSGARGGGKLPLSPIKNLKDIDLRFDIDFKGTPLYATFQRDTVDDLKLVKFVGDDGRTNWGYKGTVDADARVVKLALNSVKSGAKVAELALNLSAGDDDHPSDL